MTLKLLLLSIPAFSVYSCMAFDMLFIVTENYPPNYSSAFTVNEYFIIERPSIKADHVALRFGCFQGKDDWAAELRYDFAYGDMENSIDGSIVIEDAFDLEEFPVEGYISALDIDLGYNCFEFDFLNSRSYLTLLAEAGSIGDLSDLTGFQSSAVNFRVFSKKTGEDVFILKSEARPIKREDGVGIADFTNFQYLFIDEEATGLDIGKEVARDVSKTVFWNVKDKEFVFK